MNNNMRIKKSQFKEAVKAVVRECLNERCGSYKLIREKKADPKADPAPIDDIVKFVIRKLPDISGDPAKIARVAGLLFHKQTGWGPPDHETLLGVVRNHIQGGSSDSQDECGGMEEAGLTSETGAEGSEGYDEKKEIMLIKVMALISKKLEAMHAGMPGSEVDPTSACPAAGGEEEPAEEPSPFGSDSDSPLDRKSTRLN